MNRGTVLVVERDPDLRNTMACWLADEWEVAMARNCAHALNDYTPVDVLVVGGDGDSDISAVLARFAERGYAGPAVTVSTRGDTPTADGIAVTPLEKPVRQRELLSAVDGAAPTASPSEHD